jgi:hypothetical protein
MLKNPSKYEINKIISLPAPLVFPLYDCAGRIARELWWTNQEFSPVDIIPPLFSMFIYHLGDEL